MTKDDVIDAELRSSIEGRGPDFCDARDHPRPVQHGGGSLLKPAGKQVLYQIGNLHRVTICRELKHSHQIITSEHVGTDRRRNYAGTRP